MTNSDATFSEASQTGGRKRRFRPFVAAPLAAGLALLGIGVFAGSASAHNTTVSGVATCASPDYSITWTITNDYPEVETATITSVTGGLGTLSSSVLTIPDGSTANPTPITVTQTLPATFSGSDDIAVTGTWPQPIPDTVSVTGSVALPTGCFPPGLSVTKSIVSPAEPVSLQAGSSTPVVYGLAVEDTGVLDTSSGVTVTDEVPAHMTYVAGSATCITVTSPTCTTFESGGTVSFTFQSGLTAGTTYSVSFAATVDATAPAGPIVNMASYTGPGCTPPAGASVCSTNQKTITVTSIPVTPVVTVAKSANASAVTAGQTTPVTYTLTASNATASDTDQATVISDVIPNGLTYVANSASCGTTTGCTKSFDSATDTVTFTLSTVAANSSKSVTFKATVDAGDTTSITNQATFTGDCTPAAPAPTCTSNPVTITVANITVAKSDSAGSSSVNPGQVVTYTLTADNSGSGPGSVTVTDSAPTGTTLTTPAPACPPNSSASCTVTVTGSAISWVITSLPAASSDALTFAVVVNPGTGGTHITNTGLFTEPGCTTAGGCSTNTTDNPVPPPTSPSGPGTTTTTTPTPTTTTTTVPAVTAPTTAVPTAPTAGRPISGATTVHTGEPFAGSTPYVLAVLGFGLSLVGLGQIRRRRATKAPPA